MSNNDYDSMQSFVDDALTKMNVESGDHFSYAQVNLAELQRRTGIFRSEFRRWKDNGFLENCIHYSNPRYKELAMVFSFHHLKVDYKAGDKWQLMEPDITELKRLFAQWQEGMQDVWNATFWCNHDQSRAVLRFGDDDPLAEGIG